MKKWEKSFRQLQDVDCRRRLPSPLPDPCLVGRMPNQAPIARPAPLSSVREIAKHNQSQGLLETHEPGNEDETYFALIIGPFAERIRLLSSVILEVDGVIGSIRVLRLHLISRYSE